jgi:hypothetical protein
VSIDHGLRGYRNSGCRCDICLEAHAQYQKQYRARRKKTKGDVHAETVANGPVGVVGAVERAVKAELKTLSSAAQKPSLAAAAIAMAKILDDHTLATSHPSSARQLNLAMQALRATAKPDFKTSVGRIARASIAGPDREPLYPGIEITEADLMENYAGKSTAEIAAAKYAGKFEEAL